MNYFNAWIRQRVNDFKGTYLTPPKDKNKYIFIHTNEKISKVDKYPFTEEGVMHFSVKIFEDFVSTFGKAKPRSSMLEFNEYSEEKVFNRYHKFLCDERKRRKSNKSLVHSSESQSSSSSSDSECKFILNNC